MLDSLLLAHYSNTRIYSFASIRVGFSLHQMLVSLVALEFTKYLIKIIIMIIIIIIIIIRVMIIIIIIIIIINNNDNNNINMLMVVWL